MDTGVLIARIAKNDKVAFEQLYRLMRGQLVLQANALLAGDIAAAEDAVDEAFLDIWSKAGSFAGKGSARGWMRRIVRNKVIDHVRRRERCREAQTLDGVLEVPSEDVSPETSAIAHDEQSRVGRALKALPGDQQEVLNLFYYLELSVQEIAQQIGVPTGTVKSRLFHGRKRLHDCLASATA